MAVRLWTESAQLRFRGQTRARMKGHQIAGEWIPNYVPPFLFPSVTAIARYLLEEFNSPFAHKEFGFAYSGSRFYRQTFSRKRLDMNVIMCPFDVFT